MRTFGILLLLVFGGIFPAGMEAQVIMEEQVFFDSDQFTLTLEHHHCLSALAQRQAQQKAPPLRVSVVGYSDEVGSPEHNLALSQKRADAVIAYLYELGMDGENVQVEAWGETHPLFSNQDEKGRSKNRCVSIRIEYASEDASSASAEIENFLTHLQPPPQHFKIIPGRDNSIQTAGGAWFILPKGSFDTQTGRVIDLYIDEANKTSDLVRWSLSTSVGEDLLVSEGMFRLRAEQADKPLELKKPILMMNPTDSPNPGTELYYGNRDPEGQLNWISFDQAPTGALAKSEALPMTFISNSDLEVLAETGNSSFTRPTPPKSPSLFNRIAQAMSKKARSKQDSKQSLYEKELAIFIQDSSDRVEILTKMNQSLGDFDFNSIAQLTTPVGTAEMGLIPSIDVNSSDTGPFRDIFGGDTKRRKRERTSKRAIPPPPRQVPFPPRKNSGYYMAPLLSLGWNNSDWLQKIPRERRSAVQIAGTPGIDQRFLLVFKEQRSLIAIPRNRYNRNVFSKDAPHDCPFWVVGIQVVEGQAFMAISEHTIRGKIEVEPHFTPVDDVDTCLDFLDEVASFSAN